MHPPTAPNCQTTWTVTLRQALRGGVAFVIVASFLGYSAMHAGTLWASFRPEPAALGAIAGLTVLHIGTHVLISRLLLAALGVGTPWRQLAAVQASSIVLSYLPLRVDTLVRAHVYKKAWGLPYTEFVGLSLFRTLATAATASMVCIAALFLGDGLPRGTLASLVATFALFLFLICGTLLVPLPRLEGGWLPKTYNRLLTARRSFLTRPRLVPLLLALLAFWLAIAAARTYFAFACVRTAISPSAAIFIGAVNVLVTLVAFTPGALGLREEVAGGLAAVLGDAFHAGFLAALVERCVILCVAGVLGTWAIPVTLRLATSGPTGKDPLPRGDQAAPGALLPVAELPHQLSAMAVQHDRA